MAQGSEETNGRGESGNISHSPASAATFIGADNSPTGSDLDIVVNLDEEQQHADEREHESEDVDVNMEETHDNPLNILSSAATGSFAERIDRPPDERRVSSPQQPYNA
jgi:hypothetical protein